MGARSLALSGKGIVCTEAHVCPELRQVPQSLACLRTASQSFPLPLTRPPLPLESGPLPVAAGAAATARRVRSPRRLHPHLRSGSLPRPPHPREPAAETRVSPRPLPLPNPPRVNPASSPPSARVPTPPSLVAHMRNAGEGGGGTPHVSSNQTGKNCSCRPATP